MNECFEYIYGRLLDIETEINSLGTILEGSTATTLRTRDEIDKKFGGDLLEVKTISERIRDNAEEDKVSVAPSISFVTGNMEEVKEKLTRVNLSTASNKSSILAKVISLSDGQDEIAVQVAEVNSLVPEGSGV